MKILILGGTGAMGSHLTSLYVNSGHEVTVTSRSRSGHQNGAHYVQGNARSHDFLEKMLRSHWDVIVDFMIYDTQGFLARMPQLLSNSSQYIYLSSSRVYAQSELPLTEDSPRLLDASRDSRYLSTDEYALAKARQENALAQSSYKNWTVIRPYITYSEERLQLGVLEKEGWLYRALRGRPIVFSKDIAERATTLTYGLDVARAIEAITGRSEALSEAFHPTITSALTWREVANIYLAEIERVIGYRPEVRFESLDRFSKAHRSYYQIHYDRLYNRIFDNSKIGKFIDTTTFVQPDAGLRMCLNEFIGNQNFKSINWRSEAVKDRFCKASTPLAEISGTSNLLKYIAFRHLIP